VYVGTGTSSASWHEGEPSLIDLRLPVSRTSPSTSPPLGYWPSYARLTPEARRCYLEWLAMGRRNPSIDIGYVFIFFYGLERRLLVDMADGGSELQSKGV
jgi:hypothetical protein